MDQQSRNQQTRRQFLKKAGVAVGGSLALGTGIFTTSTRTFARNHNTTNPIQHIIIACQENRSFDNYYGAYPRAGDLGIPPNYAQPDGKGGFVKPHHFSLPVSWSPNHSWQSIHSEWNNGALDGFYTINGNNAMGYYDDSDLAYYYSLADQFTLCGNYFCYQLGPSTPNRLALWSATAGGHTNNSIKKGSLDWPTIVDLLDEQHITWKCYNLGPTIVQRELEDFNALTYFKKWWADKRLYFTQDDYFEDLEHDTLPQVAFIITDEIHSEHPPADIRWGEKKMRELITALMSSHAWHSSAFFLTYDEGGGYFDHIPPPQVDAYGMGFRVPTLVISPYAKKGYVFRQLYEHASLLKFIERRFGLPTLASVNHQFDQQTPGQNNDAAQGKPFGPPAPPRDGLPQIGDFYEAFNF